MTTQSIRDAQARATAAARAHMGNPKTSRTPQLDAYTQRVDQFGGGTRARKIQERFKTDADIIRASDTLTAKGREVEIAKRYVEARTELDVLRAEYKSNVDSHRTQLQRGMFGPLDTSHEAIQSYRQARTLARQLNTSEDALQELRVAQMVGDETYARAITHHATQQPGYGTIVDRGWSQVVDAHNEHHPGTLATLKEITDLPDTEPLSENRVFGLTAPQEISSNFKGDALLYAERVVRAAEEPARDEGYAFSGTPAEPQETTDGLD